MGGRHLGELVVGGEASGVGRGRGGFADGTLLQRVNALARLVEMVQKVHCGTDCDGMRWGKLF